MRFLITTLAILFNAQLYAQVNLQNGSLGYSIPIYSFSDAKSGLQTQATLSYSSGNGLIVGEKASNTGQNWSLAIGGAIYRKQNGEPDDQNSTGAFPTIPNGNTRGFNQSIAMYDSDYQSFNWVGDTYSRNYIDNYYPNGFMYSEFPLDMVAGTQNNWPLGHIAPRELAFLPRFQSSMDKKWKHSRRALADREQDVFVYNFNGISGEFVIGKDGLVQLLNQTNLVVEKQTSDLTAQNIRTRISGFTIRDSKGIEYRFNAYELSEVLTPEEVATEGTDAFTKTTYRGQATGKFTIQKWLLTQIIHPTTNENIEFLYEPYNVDIVASKNPTYENTEGQVTETVQVMENRVKGQLKRIKFITFPDAHQLEFTYYQGFQAYARPDFPDDHPLWKIKLTYASQEKFTYTLDYGYFLKKEIKDISVIPYEADKRFTRLCLRGISKSGIGLSEPPYKFTYNTGIESTDPLDYVPAYDCMAQDHWGYYNKTPLVNLDVENPSKETLKQLLLNSASLRQPFNGMASLGLLKSVETPLGGKQSFEYEQNESIDSDNPTVLKYSGGVRVSKMTVSDGVNVANNIVTEYRYKRSDGTTSGWGFEEPNYLSEKEIKIWTVGNLNGYTNGGKLKTDVVGKLVTTTMTTVATESVIYAFSSAAVGSTFAAGVSTIASAVPPMVIFSLISQGMMQRLMYLFNPTEYIQTNAYSYSSVQARNPIGVNYSRVEVINKSVLGGMGKTVHEFLWPGNVRAVIPALTLPYSSKPRFPSWKYGLPTKTEVYNQSGFLQKEVSNNFNTIEITSSNQNHKSCKVEIIRAESATCSASTASEAIPLSDFVWEYYYPVYGRSELVSTHETNYTAAGLTAQTSKTFTYNTDYLPNSIVTAKSNGDFIFTKTYYAKDYDNGIPAILEMKNRNMLAVPISTETWLLKAADNSEYLLDATINEYTVLWNLEVKLNKVYKLETKEPILKAIIGVQSPSVLVRNASYFKLQSTMTYGNGALLTEVTTPSGYFTSKLYDYLGFVATATAKNAHANEISYTSFESNISGNWVYTHSPNIITGSTVMGQKHFRFLPSSTATITNQWTSSREARLSFWKRGTAEPNVSVQGSTLTPLKIVPNSENGWTYFEYYFTGTGTILISNVSSVSSLDIDELRLCPKDARMSTFAYDPMVGKTAECDENNRISYYDYDGLGRLKHVRDERKNIIKKICYNFSGEPESCLDLTDQSPQWRDQGTTMCETCPANTNYPSGVRLKLQKDMNASSPSHNNVRWVVDPSGTCPSPPAWVQTDVYCQQQQVAPYGNSGNQVIVNTDLNPCSQTYNQQQSTVISNPAACPITPQCVRCTEPEYKCINGVCVRGTWQITKVVRISKTLWECTYAYCFPGGEVSTYYETTTGASACTVTCF